MLRSVFVVTGPIAPLVGSFASIMSAPPAIADATSHESRTLTKSFNGGFKMMATRNWWVEAYYLCEWFALALRYKVS